MITILILITTPAPHFQRWWQQSLQVARGKSLLQPSPESSIITLILLIIVSLIFLIMTLMILGMIILKFFIVNIFILTIMKVISPLWSPVPDQEYKCLTDAWKISSSVGWNVKTRILVDLQQYIDVMLLCWVEEGHWSCRPECSLISCFPKEILYHKRTCLYLHEMH